MSPPRGLRDIAPVHHVCKLIHRVLFWLFARIGVGVILVGRVCTLALCGIGLVVSLVRCTPRMGSLSDIARRGKFDLWPDLHTAQKQAIFRGVMTDQSRLILQRTKSP
jgi:hypothetical protein